MQKMMMVAIAAGAMLAATTATAQDAGGGTHARAAITAGTLGIEPELDVRFNDHLGVRVGAGFLNVCATAESDDEEYDGKVRSAGWSTPIRSAAHSACRPARASTATASTSS